MLKKLEKKLREIGIENVELTKHKNKYHVLHICKNNDPVPLFITEHKREFLEHLKVKYNIDVTSFTLKLRELLDRFPKLYEYDYKWTDSENYKDLNEVLEIVGYKLVVDETVDDPVKAGDYNDIKGYFECEVEKL